MTNDEYNVLIAELNACRNLEDDYDGENSKSVNIDCLNLCIKYIEKYKTMIPPPDTMMHSDGTVSIHWDNIEEKSFKELWFVTSDRVHGTIIDNISLDTYHITLNGDFMVDGMYI